MKVTQVGDGVFAVEGDAANWALLVEGDALTLVDAGYPGDHDDVVASIAEIGHQLTDLEAILVTHAHVDHVGSLPRLLAQHQVPVLLSPGEAPHARREYLEQATPVDVVRNLWRPRMLPWALHLVRNGALGDASVPTAQGYAGPHGDDGALEVPGRPVPVPTPGHTSGHTAFLVPAARVLLTGDALVTGHPLSDTVGPQMLLDFFHHDPAEARRALDIIAEVDADVIVPGHGPVHHGSPHEAVAQVR